MPRPQRCRRICAEPEFTGFAPEGGCTGEVMLTIDEYEVVRIVDYQRRTHEQCAAQMDVSRTTVTEIYESARSKLADAIVNGKRIVISGGNFRLCDGSAARCCGGDCHLQNEPTAFDVKGENIMRIAVTYENGNIFQHFGHTGQFKFYDVENGVIVASQVIDTNGTGHGALATLLAAGGVDVLICGGIGGGAQMALARAGIKLYGGVSGSADEAAQAYVDGNLNYDPEAKCDHHDHGEHDCGEHSCDSHGDHNCGHNCH